MWLLLRKKSADVRLILVRLTRCKSLTGSVVMQITASDLKARNGAVEIVVQSISREITMRKTLQDIIQATDWLIGVLTSETTVSLLHNCLLFWLSSSLTAWVSLYNCCCRELLSYLFENCKITTTRRGTTCKNIKTDTREREGCSVATGCEGASSKLKTNSYVCLCLFCLCFEN